MQVWGLSICCLDLRTYVRQRCRLRARAKGCWFVLASQESRISVALAGWFRRFLLVVVGISYIYIDDTDIYVDSDPG